MGLIKSAIGIGSLLHDGIGETIRVSLTEDPVKEIRAARDILQVYRQAWRTADRLLSHLRPDPNRPGKN